MASLGELGRLTDEESADLLNRVERFQAAWLADGSTGLEWYLPPPGTRHRLAVLVQVVAADMDRRAPAGLPFRVERYVNLFPEDLTSNDLPPPLLAAEYRLRHRFTDKPALAEYQRWFPAQFDAMMAHLALLPPLVPAGLGDHTPVTSVNPLLDPHATPGSGPRLSTLNDGRRGPPPPQKPARRFSDLAHTGPVDAAPAAAANMDRFGTPSDVLPADAPYQLIRRIGSGAFGEVFEALAPGGVKVAIKRILRSVDHPASKSEKEALEAIKCLSHPFLLKTNAYWVFDDKLVIVMELADGSLTDRIIHHQEQGLPGVPPEELVPLFEQAGEALDYLHRESVSHRDVKPENILILQGYAKVADFGLARLHEHTMTVVQNTVGTPAYMAPEMWQQKVSLQSDQYSLAATYVRARIGRHLFDTNILVDMANFHINATPNLDPLPAAEQAVLLKALAKNPDDRYPSCLAFAKALRAAVFPPPPPPPMPKPVRESSGTMARTIASIVATAVTCAIAVGVVIWQMQPPRDQAKEKEPEKEKDKEKPPVVVVQPPEKKFAKYPEDWVGVEKDGTRLIDDKHYHNRLTRTVGGEVLVAVLIPRTNSSNLDTFYMLENKVTNRAYQSVWDGIANLTKANALRERNVKLVPEMWRQDKNGKLLDIKGKGSDGSLPVMGVTAVEAILVAEKLGGSLPTFQQWLKAAGLLEDKVDFGPAGAALTPEEEALPLEMKRALFAKRKLALGLPDGPIPVNDPRGDGDVSRPWQIRQLVSNGKEWLGENSQGQLVLISPPPPGQTQARVVGHQASEPKIHAPTTLMQLDEEYSVETVTGDGYAGFRIVLKPR